MILFGLVLPRDNDDCSVVVGGCWGWHSDDIVDLFGGVLVGIWRTLLICLRGRRYCSLF